MKITKEIYYGVGILSLYAIWALGWFISAHFAQGSLLRPYRPASDITKELYVPLRDGYILGTDIHGRSLFEVISSGLIYSLGMAFTVSLICISLGIIIGYLTARLSGILRNALDTFTNLIFVFPSILIAILIMSIVGQSFWGLVFALVITGWPAYARIARGEAMRVLGLSYVESAKAVGIGEVRLFFKVILPAIMPMMLIHLILGLGGVIVSEAALGFLGLGGSEYSWGSLLSTAKSVLLEAPHVVISISLIMAGLIIGLNLCGDGLRDYFDPHNSR